MVPGSLGKPARLQAIQATMDIRFPDGHNKKVIMHDDGLHSDQVRSRTSNTGLTKLQFADDGVYGASIEAYEAGYYEVEAVFQGELEDGTAFARSTEHLFPVISRQFSITPEAM